MAGGKTRTANFLPIGDEASRAKDVRDRAGPSTASLVCYDSGACMTPKTGVLARPEIAKLFDIRSKESQREQYTHCSCRSTVVLGYVPYYSGG